MARAKAILARAIISKSGRKNRRLLEDAEGLAHRQKRFAEVGVQHDG